MKTPYIAKRMVRMYENVFGPASLERQRVPVAKLGREHPHVPVAKVEPVLQMASHAALFARRRGPQNSPFTHYYPAATRGVPPSDSTSIGGGACCI